METETNNTASSIVVEVTVDLAKNVVTTAAGVVIGLGVVAVTSAIATKVHERHYRKLQEDFPGLNIHEA